MCSFFPQVTITTRQLISHKAGIRHYHLKNTNKEENEKENKSVEDGKVQPQSQTGKNSIILGNETSEEEEKASANNDNKTTDQKEKQNKIKRCCCGRPISNIRKSQKKKKEENEFYSKEYYFTGQFESIEEALELFQNDDLLFKPGE